MLIPPDRYFRTVREVLDRYDVLLILDDVICGFAVGTWFGSDRFGITPDMMTTAKGLTGGYLPMTAVLIADRFWSVIEESSDVLDILGHGFTTSGHRASSAFANLDIIERENLVARTGALSAQPLDRVSDQLRKEAA